MQLQTDFLGYYRIYYFNGQFGVASPIFKLENADEILYAVCKYIQLLKDKINEQHNTDSPRQN